MPQKDVAGDLGHETRVESVGISWASSSKSPSNICYPSSCIPGLTCQLPHNLLGEVHFDSLSKQGCDGGLHFIQPAEDILGIYLHQSMIFRSCRQWETECFSSQLLACSSSSCFFLAASVSQPTLMHEEHNLDVTSQLVQYVRRHGKWNCDGQHLAGKWWCGSSWSSFVCSSYRQDILKPSNKSCRYQLWAWSTNVVQQI